MKIRRIMLLCGGLKPGADGVGDYCRRLAEVLSKLGVESLLVSLNDRETDIELIEEPSASARVIRLPERLQTSKRSRELSSLVEDWCPDWVSLQFVSYSFNRKGVPLKELYWLPHALRECRLHVMLHELWVGLGHSATIKNALIGAVQKPVITTLIRRLRPEAIHTSNDYYRGVLRNAGLETEVLPLFGNIPVTPNKAGRWLNDAIREHGGPEIGIGRNNFWLFGLFGSIAADWPARSLLLRLSTIAREASRRAVIISAGAAGPHASALFTVLRSEFRDIDFVSVGPRSPHEISQFLNAVDFGLTSYPLYILGKSSSTTAMLEHGLPVIVAWDGMTATDRVVSAPWQSLIWQDDVHLAERLKNPPLRIQRPDWSMEVAKALLSRLQKSASP